MKKSLLAFALFCCIFKFFAQEQTTTDDPFFGKHEIKLNALTTILGAVEVNYEYLLNKQSGLGISFLLAYDNRVIEDITYYVSPYYRHYFGKKYAGGFFLEGFGMLNRIDRDIDFLFEDGEENWVTDFAIGIGLGGKWMSRGGFVGEINYGIARNLFQTSDDDDFNFVGKIGITIGYRF